MDGDIPTCKLRNHNHNLRLTLYNSSTDVLINRRAYPIDYTIGIIFIFGMKYIVLALAYIFHDLN